MPRLLLRCKGGGDFSSDIACWMFARLIGAASSEYAFGEFLNANGKLLLGRVVGARAATSGSDGSRLASGKDSGVCD